MLDTKDGIYVMKALEHTKADSAAFAKDLDNFRAQMIRAARQDRVRSYLEALRQNAKVVDDRKKVLQQTARRDAAGGVGPRSVSWSHPERREGA